jgi:two-component system, NarL family, response regulator NreC
MEIRIYIVDSCAIIRDGIKILLENQEGLTVVGSSVHKHNIIQKLADLHPDIVILNLSGQITSWVDTIRMIGQTYPAVKVIVIIAQIANEEVISLLRAGVSGCILAEFSSKEIIDATHSVYGGRRYLTKKISEKLIEGYIKKNEAFLSNNPLFNLSIREKEVLQLVAEGKTSAQVATILCISVRTVNTYRYRVMKKLNIVDLLGLVKFAIQNGLTPP